MPDGIELAVPTMNENGNNRFTYFAGASALSDIIVTYDLFFYTVMQCNGY